MTIYVVFLVLLLIPSIYTGKLRIGSYYTIFLIWFSLTLFAGLRYDNPDWQGYSDMFQNICKGNGDASNDLGYNLFLKLISLFSHDSIFMFSVVAGFAVAINIKCIIKYTPYVFLAILLYYVNNFLQKEMIQIRVGLASSICLYTMRYISAGNWKKSYLGCLIAISVHLTSIIFLLVILARQFNIARRRWKHLILVALIIGTVYPFGQILKDYVGINNRLDDYIAYGSGAYASSLGVWTNLNVLKSLGIVYFLHRNYDKLEKNNRMFVTLYTSYCIGLIWLIIFNDFAIIGARMSNILFSVEPILLTIPIGLYKSSKRAMYKCAVVLLAVLLFNINLSTKVSPYRFYYSNYQMIYTQSEYPVSFSMLT